MYKYMYIYIYTYIYIYIHVCVYPKSRKRWRITTGSFSGRRIGLDFCWKPSQAWKSWEKIWSSKAYTPRQGQRCEAQGVGRVFLD